MAKKKKSKRLFEVDRKMELRLRLALSQVGEAADGKPHKLDRPAPEQELVARLIDRVRSL